MSKRNDFITYIRTIKKASSNIPDDLYKGLIRQGIQDYGIFRDEAEKILKDEGLTVGGGANYFEVLRLSIDELENLSEIKAKERVEKACNQLFRSLRNSANPKKRKQLNEVIEAKKVLIDEGKLQQYIAENISETPLETDIDDLVTHNLCLAPFKLVNGQRKQYSHVIIPKMTPLPCEVDHTFGTLEDNQSQILVSLYQGLEQNQFFEEISDPAAFKLGDCLIELPPNLPAGSPVKVTYKYNLDNILEVTAEVPDGRTTIVTIQSNA